MNYGFLPTDKDKELAKRIAAFVATLVPDQRGQRPYVERDGMYPGVRLRRITHYSDEVVQYIVDKMGEIYDELGCKERNSK
jgi:hypothetical protein